MSLLEITNKLNTVLIKFSGSFVTEAVFYLFLTLNILRGSWLIYNQIFHDFDNNSVNLQISERRHLNMMEN